MFNFDAENFKYSHSMEKVLWKGKGYKTIVEEVNIPTKTFKG